VDSQTGRYLIIIGGAILLMGIIIYFFGGSLKWIGHLPGDIRIERENFAPPLKLQAARSRFYFPLTTLILLNLIIFLLFRIEFSRILE
jgi:hypothetical protein